MASASDRQVYHQIRKVGCHRQSRLAYTYVISAALSYKYILCTEVAHTNYLAGSLNIYIGKTPVSDFSILSGHPSADGKLYYSGSLFLNESIDLTSIGL